MKNLTLLAIGLAALLLALWLARADRAMRPPTALAPSAEITAESSAPSPEPDEAAVVVGPAASFCGIVIDGLTRERIAGARALIQRSSRVLQLTALERLELAAEGVSDDEGRFVLAFARTVPIPACFVLAEGYGLGWLAADPEFGTPELAASVELLPAAELELHVTDADGEHVPGTAVELSVRWGEDDVFPCHETGWRGGGEWDATTDRQGLVRFAGLRPETAMVWRVYGARDVARSEQVALGIGERRRIEVVVGSGARVLGTVLDAGGIPVPDLELWVARPGEERRFRRESRFVARTRSDALGRFELAGLPFEPLVIGPAPDQGDIIPRAELVVPEQAVLSLVLVATRGLAISGRVVGSDEQLDGMTVVIAERSDGGDGARAELGEHGAFRTAPLAPGEYFVHARRFEAVTEVQRRAAGASDVELSFAVPRSVSVLVPEADGNLIIQVHDLERGTVEPWTESAAAFQRMLAPGTYQLQVTTLDAEVGFVPRLVVGGAEPLAEVVIPVEPGAWVTCVHVATRGTRTLRLFVDGAPFSLPDGLGGGRTNLLAGDAETLLVPAGELRAELLEGSRVVARVAATLLPGESRRILLEPR